MTVRPGQPATDFPVDPYPGRRPSGSWVIDREQRCWPVRPDEGRPSGWAVIGPASTDCLDRWLTDRGATPLAGRIPLLSYGSNACPGKILMNATPLPAVNLACEIDGLASVWCTGTTRAGRIPSTLAAVPAHTEPAVMAMTTPAELARLDVVEGRPTGWYALQILHTGRVTLENGARVLRPAAYVGARPERRPTLIDGAPLRVIHADQEAVTLLRPALGGPPPTDIGVVVPAGRYPHPGECTPAVFTYGTLMPGRSRAHLLTGHVTTEPAPAEAFGDLRDTGYGYPALTASATRKAPGTLYTLHPDAMPEILTILDQVEGTEVGLYSRQLRNVAGTLTWIYMADSCAGTGTPIDTWP
ncbi:gamma-glutamylcyclotransferase family protein [Actinoplanes subglobosus]|uniref:Gamma-glutamylcyclotransferase n=1 Tax=Actinoplanes subglobosus TaxID=1547892 RepID=A0ABV8J524_9ACTN